MTTWLVDIGFFERGLGDAWFHRMSAAEGVVVTFCVLAGVAWVVRRR